MWNLGPSLNETKSNLNQNVVLCNVGQKRNELDQIISIRWYYSLPLFGFTVIKKLIFKETWCVDKFYFWKGMWHETRKSKVFKYIRWKLRHVMITMFNLNDVWMMSDWYFTDRQIFFTLYWFRDVCYWFIGQGSKIDFIKEWVCWKNLYRFFSKWWKQFPEDLSFDKHKQAEFMLF